MAIPAARPPEPIEPGVINCAAYSGAAGRGPVDRQDQRRAAAGGPVRLDRPMHEPSADVLARVQRQFGLHDLAVEDAHTAHQRPKIEQYDNSLFVVLRTAQLAPARNSSSSARPTSSSAPATSSRSATARCSRTWAFAQRCEATPQLLVKGAGLRPLRADGLHRRSVLPDRRAARG